METQDDLNLSFVHELQRLKTYLRTCAQSDQNLDWAHFWMTQDAKFLHADNESSDQTDAQADFSLPSEHMWEGTS